DSTINVGFWHYDYISPKKDSAGHVNIADSAWHHVASVYENNTYKLYVDGNEVPISGPNGNGATNGVTDINTVLNATTAKLSFGAINNDPNPYGFNGGLDEVRIYKRALSAADITELYNYEPTVSSVSNTVVDKKVQFYPNPATNMVQLSNIADVKVYNLAGQLELEIENVKSFDVSNLQSGLYLLKVNDNQFQKLMVK
ncbi:MAG: T9SS type A sorting domain-containing protein, partial [Bacteroidales bacterium]|nr:T9SS type A sorting domain-containing protein [Bacteroidales bacterium]